MKRLIHSETNDNLLRKRRADEVYRSYHMKTILLELTTHSCLDEISTSYAFAKALVDSLRAAYLKKELPSFFIPTQNLLQQQHDGNFREIIDVLENILIERPHQIYLFSSLSDIKSISMLNENDLICYNMTSPVTSLVT